MIRADITSKTFGETPVLGRIRFEIATGETLALVGPSGVGKSTLLRILAGLDAAFDGTVTRPETLAFVFQEPTLLPWRTVLQNILLPHPQLSSDQARDMLDHAGLAGKEHLFPRQLSLGQQRRLSLARAFARPPELLIMDEPFVSLDEGTAEKMLALTEALISEHRPATVFVTHDMREAARLATRTLRLEATDRGAKLVSDPAP